MWLEAPEVSCVLTRRAFRSVWTLLVGLYAFIALYLLAHAAMYAVFYAFPITFYYTTTFQLLPAGWYLLVSGAYVATAAFYVRQLFKIIANSLRHRELRLATPPHSTTGAGAPASNQLAVAATARRLYAFVFSTSGLLGVRGPFFTTVTLLREVLEIAVQTHQAYQSSRYTASVWINLTFGGLIITNCFSTPLLHWWFHSPEDTSGGFRLVVLSIDLALDLVWFLVLPFLFWLPYYVALSGNEAVPFDDTFMPKALMELRFIFVTSLSDLVFVKLLPAMSVFFALRKVQYLVHARPPHRPPSTSQQATKSRRSQSVQIAPLAQLLPADSPPASQPPHANKRLKQTETLLTVVLGSIGIFAVVIYVLAYLVYSPQCVAGCQVVLRPWFEVSNIHCFCAVQEINCQTYGIHGSAQELTHTLASVETRGLLSLILTHCDDLTVPPSILRFRDLYRLELFKCTISSWSAPSALTASAFPQLGIVSLVPTAITSIPGGLLQGDLPQTLREIHVVDSKLASLPDNLAELWPHVKTLYLERAAFSEYPSALSRMPNLESLSLYKNHVSTIADNAFENNSFVYFLFNDNPLRSLPASLRKSTHLAALELQNTSIPDIAQATRWAGDGSARDLVTIFGLGSPFCQGLQAHPTLPAHVRVTCEPLFKWFNGEKSVRRQSEAAPAETGMTLQDRGRRSGHQGVGSTRRVRTPQLRRTEPDRSR